MRVRLHLTFFLPSFLSPTVYYFCCPGYNTGKRTDEWVARQRREVRVEKFSQVNGRLVNHSQNAAIASYANISEQLVKEAIKSQEYRAITAQMEELDLVIMVSRSPIWLLPPYVAFHDLIIPHRFLPFFLLFLPLYSHKGGTLPALSFA